MLSTAISNFKATAGSVSGTLPLTVMRSFSAADPGYARAAVSVTHRGESRNNMALVMESIRQLMDGKGTPVLGSWMSVSRTDFSEDLIGLVSVNKQVVAYTPDMKGFKALSSNMFMDDEKSMWTLKESEGGKLLIRTSAYDDDTVLNDLLSSISSAKANAFDYHTQAVNSEFRQPYDGGNYIAYVSKSHNDDIRTGFVVSTVCDDNGRPSREVVVLSRVCDSYEVIDRNMILSVCSSDDMDSKLEAVANSGDMEAVSAALKSNVSLDDILSYYRTLFSRNAEYFRLFEERIRSHFCC
jgi:hypothetical protein